MKKPQKLSATPFVHKFEKNSSNFRVHADVEREDEPNVSAGGGDKHHTMNL